MKGSGRSLSTSRERLELRQLLVVAQVALSLVLLVGALLFSGSLRNLLSVDAGFQHSGVLITNLDFSRLKLSPSRRTAFRLELLQRIRAVPGIKSAAEVAIVPLSGGSTTNRVWKEGVRPDSAMDAKFNWFGEGYPRTMGMTLLAGRDFNDRDTIMAPKVAIVNESFARRMGLGPNPVGVKFHREATPSQPEQVFEIVGLVRDTKYYSLREEFLAIAFLCLDQVTDADAPANVMIRASVPLGQITSAIRTIMSQTNPDIGVSFESFDTMMREGLLRERLMATLSGFFGALAMLISAVGLYGVMSYLVVRRTNEIGVRIALGATRGVIVALILRQASKLLAIGAAVGLVLTLAAAGTAKSILFGLKPYDAATLVLATALLAAVTAAASYLPARRAARLEPVVALREE
jgi:predicted permease